MGSPDDRTVHGGVSSRLAGRQGGVHQTFKQALKRHKGNFKAGLAVVGKNNFERLADSSRNLAL